MAKDITLRQLRYFVAAAETGQLSMAAKTSHVAQSTVTNAILTLEASMGVTLFQRKPNGVTLTADGYKFYHHTKHILDSLDVAINEPQFRTHDLKGSIRIAASYTLLGYFLPPRMARFRQQYPDLNIDLRALERSEIEEQVAANDVELGIVLLSNVQERKRFGHHVLLRSRRQLWTPANHPLQAKEFASLEDISHYPYILITADEVESTTQRYFAARDLTPNVVFKTSSMEALRGLIAHDFGVTILADMVYRPWSLEGAKIEATPILDVLPHMEVGLIWNKEQPMSKGAGIFRQFLIHSSGS